MGSGPSLRLALLAALLGGCATSSPKPATTATPTPGPDAPPPSGNPNGPFAIPVAHNKLNLVLKHFGSAGEANLGALGGKVVLVDFWATWCGPCHEAARAYERLYTQESAKGLEVYGVSVDSEGAPIAEFVADQGITYPILVDPGAQVSGPVFDIDAIPVTLIADRHGVIRFTHRGFEGDSEALVKGELEQLLAEP